MSLPPGFLDELRNRVPISRIVGRKVTWDLRKTNQARGDWWAPCPFHQEKSASFHCDDQKGFYYCFGCHAKGDALSFLREADNLDFMDAVKLLAAEAGMAMPERDPGETRWADRRTQLVEVTEAAARWFRVQLQGSAAGEARDYLKRRGLTQQIIDRFEIGFAPDSRQALLGALRDKGVDPKLIEEAGLIATPDGGGTPYDRFRGRIIFPIRDARGRAIGFGGRAMDPNARAKYLNSPETPLFDKGRNLYNVGPARTAVGKGAPLIVVEGYMDVIALVAAGFEGAVAPLGTAITGDQLHLMWRISPEPVVTLDGDAAGQRAAMRLVDIALPMTGPRQALRFAVLPGGQDPDDLIRAQGPAAMAGVLDAARPLVDLLWTRETEGRVFDSPERRAALDKALNDAVGRIEDPYTRGHYTEELKRRKWDSFAPRRERPGRGKDRRVEALPETRTAAIGAEDGDALLESTILAICAGHPALVNGLEARLERMYCGDPGRAVLLHDLLAGTESPEGRAALESILANPHVRSAPPILHPDDEEMAATILANILDKLEFRRAAHKETARAETEMSGLVDEGLTWRLSESARALHRAEQPQLQDTSDLGEDREALRAHLDAARRGQIWRKKSRDG